MDRLNGIWSRPRLWLVLLFVGVRLSLIALGCRFDDDNLTSWMQIADVALLRDHLWRTLWYLHSQPPLFNLLIGLALPLGPDGFRTAMGLVYAAVTLGGILAFHALAAELTHRPRLALIAAAWLCVSPAVLLFSQKLYYDGLVPWLLCMALWGLHAGLTRRSLGWWLFGFGMFAAVVLLRSMIHPLLFVVVGLIYGALAHGQRWRVAGAAAVPALAIALVMIKNLALFGAATLSSWAPLNLGHTTVDRMPLPQRLALIREHRLSPLARIDGFSPPSVYVAMLPPAPPTGEPSLDELVKSTGEPNWNHIVYTRVGRERMHDALAAMRIAPGSFAKVIATSVYHFHRPPSEFKGLEKNLARIAPWERFANAVIGLQPAAWLGGTLDPTRPDAPWLQMALAEWLETFAFLAGAALLATDIARDARTRRWPDAALATPLAVAAIGLFVIIVSSVFDVWENNRAHFDVGPVLLLGALWSIARWRDRRAAARSPGLSGGFAADHTRAAQA